MHYLSATHLTKSFGDKPLFSDIFFHIQEGKKIAFIAKNGKGKTTLLRMIAHKEKPDEGKIEINKEIEIIFFEQENAFDQKKTAMEIIYEADDRLMRMINTYREMASSEHTAASDMEKILAEMHEAQAWDIEAKVDKILTELDIAHLKDRPVGELSGGQIKRLSLAQNLIRLLCSDKKTLLLMDEPTNHLDIAMIEWLERYLNKIQSALLVVSHDRYFLDAVCNEIWELDDDGLFTYDGNYAFFLEQKALRTEMEKAHLDKAQNQYRRELDWMRKQPKARTTKSKTRINNFYEIEKKASQNKNEQEWKLYTKASRLGGKIVEIKQAGKSYGGNVILKEFNYTFNRGDRIGIVGKNGVGKTTFLNVLQRLEPIDNGTIKVGETVVFGYYSQKGLLINENIRVIEYMKNIAEYFPLEGGKSLSASKFLEMFLFPPDKQYTFLNALSGGEKRRLQLLTVLFSNPNFLILDEPTNDLDLQTLVVLESFLQTYDGCVLIVSHDRYFMDKTVNHIFYFEGEGKVKIFPGTYSEYMLSAEQKKEENRADENEKLLQNSVDPALEKRPVKLSYKHKKEIEDLEHEIARLEEEKSDLSAKLGKENAYADIETMGNRLKEIARLIEKNESRWMEIMGNYA